MESNKKVIRMLQDFDFDIVDVADTIFNYQIARVFSYNTTCNLLKHGFKNYYRFNSARYSSEDFLNTIEVNINFRSEITR